MDYGLFERPKMRSGGLDLLAFLRRNLAAFLLKALAQHLCQVDDILRLGSRGCLGRLLALAFGVDEFDQDFLLAILELRRVELGKLLVDQHAGDFQKLRILLACRDTFENRSFIGHLAVWPKPRQKHAFAVRLDNDLVAVLVHDDTGPRRPLLALHCVPRTVNASIEGLSARMS
jgi:hypothetical protein